jgi:hypothetical protein
VLSGAMPVAGSASASEAEVDFSMRAQVRYTSKRRSRTPRRRIEGLRTISDSGSPYWVRYGTYVEAVIIST